MTDPEKKPGSAKPAAPVPRPGLINVDDSIDELGRKALEEARRREAADKGRRDAGDKPARAAPDTLRRDASVAAGRAAR